MDKATLDRHLTYTAWATNRLLDAVTVIPGEHLKHDFKTGDRTILGTLAHVFGADRLWLGRVHGRHRATVLDERDRDLTVIREEWPRIHSDWRGWLAAYQNDLDSPIDYTDMKGNPHRSSACEIILHVVNHGTHHRGQVSGFLRALGHTPPPLDLIFFYRGL